MNTGGLNTGVYITSHGVYSAVVSNPVFTAPWPGVCSIS